MTGPPTNDVRKCGSCLSAVPHQNDPAQRWHIFLPVIFLPRDSDPGAWPLADADVGRKMMGAEKWGESVPIC
jgi:hypothetical protein